ncbi:MAG: M20/M25/M40 family metallo-hydrolase [Deltaproteobacteria bacterium]|nr:M20/M25/M40 family metallo-hydrolase [Deltaproteobacteria bacterium]
MSNTEQAIQYIHTNFERFIRDLIDYSKIPSVSFPGYPPEPLVDSARWTARKMEAVGLEHVEILEISGAPPFVVGDWLHAPGAPTILLYAHHDVQPPGRPEKWLSPAFKPERRGDRLYGRGVVDDKAGALMHLFALEAYLKSSGKLPVNVRFLIEGEEETGSAHLGEFVTHYKDRLKADLMVLTDTANLDIGLPSLTYRLRGLVDAIVEVRTLDHPVHSGMWGGPTIDALTVLNKILARLTTADGKIAIPDFYEGILPVEGVEKERLRALPFDEKKFLQEIGGVSSLQLSGEQEFSAYERIWCRPACAILGIDAPQVAKTSNQIVEWARAKVSIRTVSGMNPKKSLERLCDFLAKDPPYGAEVNVKPGTAGNPWKVDPVGPAYEAAARALKKGFGRDAVFIGCGGSIPFVEPLTKEFGGIPALLIGLEDPYCNAHGENESLFLPDWKKGMEGAVWLYSEKLV